MFKNLLILLLSISLLFSCSKKNKETVVSEPTDEEKAVIIYAEAVEALNKGDAYYLFSLPRILDVSRGC